jgi:hypothetical protein
MEPWRLCGPVISDSQDEDEDPDRHESEKSDPDPHESDADPQPVYHAFRCLSLQLSPSCLPIWRFPFDLFLLFYHEFLPALLLEPLI